MKNWIKYLLGIFAILIVLVCVAVVAWWPEISVLRGTEVPGENIVIPASVANFPALNQSSGDWPCWRGAKGDARSNITGILTDWKGGLKKLWEVNFLCQGNTASTWSAPVIQGNRLIVGGRSKEEDIVFCLNPDDGSVIWKSSYAAQADSTYGSGPRATPFIDKDKVYTFGRSGDLVCWNLLDGKKLWHKNVTDEGGKEPTWGHSSSPLVIGNAVIVQAGGTARVIAYDKMAGNVLWKSGQGTAGYAAIVPMVLEGSQAVLAFHGKGLSAILLESGKQLWETTWETSYDVNASTPIVEGNTIFITSDYGKGGALLQASQNEVKTLWQNDAIASHHSDPYILDGFIYGYSGQSFQNKGDFKCLNAKTGEQMWSTSEAGWGTCIWAENHLLCCDIAGNLHLVKPDPQKFIKVSEFRKALGNIRQGPVWTVPVIAGGKLYLRFNQKLVCYDLKKK